MQETLENTKQAQTAVQLNLLDTTNFPQFAELLLYREWKPGDELPSEKPLQLAQEMAQISMTPDNGCAVWLICDQQSLQAVGVITMVPVFFAGCRQLGYWVHPEHQGQGYASLALRALTQHIFEQMGVTRLQAQVVPDNAASIRVLEKGGYTREAMIPSSHQAVSGEILDTYLYGLVKE